MAEIVRNNSMHMTLKLGTLRELRYPDMDSQATKLCQSDPFMTEGHNHFSLTLGDHLGPILLINIGPTDDLSRIFLIYSIQFIKIKKNI